jgi:hypothetical protein
MGLFDDFIGIAKDFHELKDDVTSAVGRVVSEAASVTEEAAGAAMQIKDEATSAVRQIQQGIARDIGQTASDSDADNSDG